MSTIDRDALASQIAAHIKSDGWSPLAVTPFGTIESDAFVPPVYWDGDRPVVESDDWQIVRDFHPSEFVDSARHVEANLGSWLDDVAEGDGFVVCCVEVIDLEDPDALVGWALVAKSVELSAVAS